MVGFCLGRIYVPGFASKLIEEISNVVLWAWETAHYFECKSIHFIRKY
jgi:hypothetical protein